jgi:hypothetical protein
MLHRRNLPRQALLIFWQSSSSFAQNCADVLH